MTSSHPSRRDVLGWLSGLGAAVATAPWLGAGVADGEPVPVTVLRGVTLVDTSGVPPRPEATVVVAGDRIQAVGGRGLPLPPGARVLDLAGRYVIPGLWDMHVHGAYWERITLPLCLVHGVVGFREMWGFPQLHELRRRIEGGQVLGPRLVIGSAIVDGPHSVLDGARVVRTPEEARQAVREEVAGGADFVKVYPFLDRELLTALAGECRRLGVPFAGHASDHLSLVESSALGQRSFEHMYGLGLATSAHEEELRRRIAGLPLDPADPFAWFKAVRELERQGATAYHPGRARRLAEVSRRNGSWQTPTLRTMLVYASPAEEFADDPRMKYLPPFYREFWARNLARMAPVTPAEVRAQREYFAARLRLVGEQHRLGVGTLLGTDAGNPYTFPGFAVHEELELLVRAGLDPLAALRAATSEAARFLGGGAGEGTLGVGQRADLVVLDGNPLADIRNTRRVHTVLTRGRVLGPAERARMLAEVEKAALETPGAEAGGGQPATGCC